MTIQKVFTHRSTRRAPASGAIVLLLSAAAAGSAEAFVFPSGTASIGGRKADRHLAASVALTSTLSPASTGAGADRREAEPLPAIEEETFDWHRQWYPAAPVDILDESAPQECTILGRKLVLFRSGQGGDGAAVWSALDDTCPHRRTSLSTGKVVPSNAARSGGGGDGSSCNVACRFHGWEFDADGGCAKIPMMEDGSGVDLTSRAFRTASYPARVADGLLWVWMDPSVPIESLPDLPPGAVREEGDEGGVERFVTRILYKAPVSHRSMTENTFDPSHAPFVHEGVSAFGVTYSSSKAVPMRRYEVVQDLDPRTGFALEHTPYQESDFPDAVTTRRFVPPCTTVTSTPFSEIRIYQVPESPRTTSVIFTASFPRPKNAVLAWLMNAASKSDILHTLRELKDATTRFNDQDRIIMQDQDDRKMAAANGDAGEASSASSSWSDLYPTASDVGVATYQKWIRKFGRGGPFPPDSGAARGDDGALSAWERHGKYCARCKRSLKKLAGLERKARTAADASLLFAGLAGFASLLLRGARESAAATSLSCSVLFLAATFGLRSAAVWAAGVLEKMFVGSNVGKRQIPQVYQF